MWVKKRSTTRKGGVQNRKLKVKKRNTEGSGGVLSKIAWFESRPRGPNEDEQCKSSRAVSILVEQY